MVESSSSLAAASATESWLAVAVCLAGMVCEDGTWVIGVPVPEQMPPEAHATLATRVNVMSSVPVGLQDEDLSVLQAVLSVGLDGGYGRAVHQTTEGVVALMDATELLNATTTWGRSLGPLWDFDA